MANVNCNETNVTKNISSWTKQDASQTYDMPSGLQTFIMYLISSGAILTNLTVFYTVPRLKKKINDSTRSAMLSLAVTDMTLGVGTFISRTIYLINPGAFFKHFCAIDAYFNTFLGTMTVLGLCFLNLDKFLTLVFPLRYTIHMTSKKAAVILTTIWIIMLIYFISFGVLHSSEGRYIENAFICYGHIIEDTALVSVRQILDIVLNLVFPVTVCIVSLIGICCVMGRYRTRLGNLHEGQQRPSSNIGKTSVYAVYAVNFTFFLMIMPLIVCEDTWRLVTDDTPGPDAYFATVWLGAANSAVNPLIYIPTMRSYKEELKDGFAKLIKGKCKCRNKELISWNSVDMSKKKKTDTSDVSDRRL